MLQKYKTIISECFFIFSQMIFGWFLGFMYEWMLNHIKWLVLIYREYLKYSDYSVQLSPSSVWSLSPTPPPYCRECANWVDQALHGTSWNSLLFSSPLYPLCSFICLSPNFSNQASLYWWSQSLWPQGSPIPCLVLVTILGGSGSCSFKLVL